MVKSPTQIARRARSRIITAHKRKAARSAFFAWVKHGNALIQAGAYTAQEVFGAGGQPTWADR